MTSSTDARRASRSLAAGTSNGTFAAVRVRLARTIRCATVDSGTRKARAISSVERPPSNRSVSATRASVDSTGWHAMKTRRRRSSPKSPPLAGTAVAIFCAASSSRPSSSCLRSSRSSLVLTSTRAKPPVSSFASVNGPSVIATFPPEDRTRVAFGPRPPVASRMPALVVSSINFPISAMRAGVGGVFALALLSTSYIRNRIVVSPSSCLRRPPGSFRAASPYCHVEQAMAEIDMGIYNSLFPLYIEACAVTQYHRRGAKPGGWGGHAPTFMNGAEIDPGAGYPCLRLASAGADRSSSDSGVGVSVNQIFTNVNWVAVPGRLDFFRGGLAAEQILDDSFYEAAVQRATAAGWFDGIVVTDALVRQKPHGMPLQEFVVRNSIGTDFAMNFARTAYCARQPLTREALGRAIAYLNAVNESARKRGYIWDAYTNNCS